MTLEKLTPDQKKMLFLVVIALFTALFVLKTLVLAPMNKKWDLARKTIAELQTKVSNADRLIKSRQQLDQDLTQIKQELIALQDENLPPRHNRFSWASEPIYQAGNDLGLDLAVSDAGASGRSSSIPQSEKDAVKLSACLPYAVNIDVSCGYRDLAELIALLQTQNPHMGVSRLEITAETSDPRNHWVSLRVEWPVWRYPSTLENLRGPNE